MGKLKVASLFSGCGGMDLGMMGGFEYLGRKYRGLPVEIIFAVDNDKYACDIFNENFDIKCLNKDIHGLDPEEVPSHHILTGGFPCTSFSIIKQNPQRLGFKDEKGRLFLEMNRILKEKKPVCFIAENVKGILSANKGKAFPLILETFKNAGYYVNYKILNAADYGVPQKRERIFIVGFRDKKISKKFYFPKPITVKKRIPLSSVISPEEKIPDMYFFSEKAVNGMVRAKEKMNKGRVQKINEPCNTIGAHLSKVSLNGTDPVLKINERYRRFTPREAAKIQSFPDTFVLAGSELRQYRAIGNAVPPVLMWHVTNEVVKAIQKTDKKILKSPDIRTKEEIRSYNMSRIRGKNTKIELRLRKELSKNGYRYRINSKEIYGKPDIVFKNKKIAIFCDSSFWHGKSYEKTIARIKSNKKYWTDKIKRNIERDKEVSEKLQEEGWTVLRFWDDEIKNNIGGVIKIIEKNMDKTKEKLS